MAERGTGAAETVVVRPPRRLLRAVKRRRVHHALTPRAPDCATRGTKSYVVPMCPNSENANPIHTHYFFG